MNLNSGLGDSIPYSREWPFKEALESERKKRLIKV